jgi:hypothetical protein
MRVVAGGGMFRIAARLGDDARSRERKNSARYLAQNPLIAEDLRL